MQKLLGLTAEDRIYMKERAEGIVGRKLEFHDDALVDSDIDYVYPILKSYDEKFREYDGVFETKKEIIEGLRNKAKNLVKENASLREQLAKKVYQKETDDDAKSTLMKLKMDGLEEEKASYEEELNYLYTLLEEVMNKCRGYEKEMEVFKKYQSELEQEEDFQSDKVIEMEGVIRSLKSQLEDKVEEVQELERSRNDYELLINDLKVEKKKAEAKCRLIEEQNEKEREQIQDLNAFPIDQIKDLQDQIQKLKLREKDLKNKIFLEEEKANQASSSRFELETEIAKISKESEQYQERIKILENKITKLEFRNEDLEKKIKDDGKRMKDVIEREAKFAVMDEEIESQRLLLINSHQRTLDEVKAKYNKMLASSTMRKDDQIKKLSEELEIVSRENDKIKLKLERSERSLKMAKNEKDAYRNMAVKIESKNKELIEIKTEINRKDQKIIELEKKIEGQDIMRRIHETKIIQKTTTTVNNVEIGDIRKENRLLKEELERVRARFERMNIEQEKIRKEERDFDAKEKEQRVKNWEKKFIQLENKMIDKEKAYEKKIIGLVETLKEQEKLSRKIRDEFEKSIAFYESKISKLKNQNNGLKAKFNKLSDTIANKETAVM